MATKKKSKKKSAKPKKSATKKPVRRPKPKAQKKSAQKKPAKKAAPIRKAMSAGNAGKTAPKKRRSSSNRRGTPAFPSETSATTSSDLLGVSAAETADSESVSELLDEGNTFEAGAVAGVENADDADEQEVHTHEVPEDDVPEEYLDND